MIGENTLSIFSSRIVDNGLFFFIRPFFKNNGTNLLGRLFIEQRVESVEVKDAIYM